MTTEITAARGVFRDYSGSVTLGGTAQVVQSAGLIRRYLLIQNISDTTMWVNFGVTAVADQPSIQIVAGASLVFDHAFVPIGDISLMCATTGKKFVIKEGA